MRHHRAAGVYYYPPPPARWQDAVVLVFPLLLWGVTTLALGVVKWALEGSDGFWSHLTNWNWMLQALFYCSALVAYVVDRSCCLGDTDSDSDDSAPRALHAGFWVHSVLWPTAWGVCWLVFWLAFFMVGNSPGEVLKLMRLYGGAYDAGFVLDMDRLLHVVPAVVNVLYVALRQYELSYMVSYYFHNEARYSWWTRSTGHRVAAYLVLLFLGPVLVTGTYLAAYDPNRVYNLTLHRVVLLVAGIGVLLVFQLGFVWYHRTYAFPSFVTYGPVPRYCAGGRHRSKKSLGRRRQRTKDMDDEDTEDSE